VGRCELDSSGSGEGPVTGSYEQGNEPSVSIKGGEFLDELRAGLLSASREIFSVYLVVNGRKFCYWRQTSKFMPAVYQVQNLGLKTGYIH
jgi:hypothetical protein